MSTGFVHTQAPHPAPGSALQGVRCSSSCTPRTWRAVGGGPAVPAPNTALCQRTQGDGAATLFILPRPLALTLIHTSALILTLVPALTLPLLCSASGPPLPAPLWGTLPPPGSDTGWLGAPQPFQNLQPAPNFCTTRTQSKRGSVWLPPAPLYEGGWSRPAVGLWAHYMQALSPGAGMQSTNPTPRSTQGQQHRCSSVRCSGEARLQLPHVQRAALSAGAAQHRNLLLSLPRKHHTPLTEG